MLVSSALTIVHRSARLTVARLRLEPDHHAWDREHCVQLGHVVAFPAASYTVVPEGGAACLADANHALLANQGQRFRRQQLTREPVTVHLFVPRPDLVVEMIGQCDASVGARREHPFRFASCITTSTDYLLQCAIVQRLEHSRADAAVLEQRALELLSRVIAGAHRSTALTMPRRDSTRQAYLATAEAVKRVIGTRFRERVSLTDIADAVNVSPFHLTRIFLDTTGVTIHVYLNRLRLRRSLEHLADRDRNLNGLALSLGYASHSHFTLAFRREFGIPPSQLRARTTLDTEQLIARLRSPSHDRPGQPEMTS